MRTLFCKIVLALGLVVAAGSAAGAAPQGADAPPGHAPHPNWTAMSYKDKNVYGGELQAGEEAMGPPFVFVLVNFGLLLTLLGWKAVPPIQRYLGKRSDLIRDALQEAGLLREEARRKLDEYNQRIKDVELEVDQLITGIRADAEKEKERIIADAKKQAEALKRDAEARISADIDRARYQLEREVIAVAVAAAEKILRERVTPADQNTLVEGFIGELQQGANPAAPGGTPR